MVTRSGPIPSRSSWVLYGSADGVNWDVCDVVKNLPSDATDLVGNRRASGAMDIGCYEAKSGFTIYVH